MPEVVDVVARLDQLVKKWSGNALLQIQLDIPLIEGKPFPTMPLNLLSESDPDISDLMIFMIRLAIKTDLVFGSEDTKYCLIVKDLLQLTDRLVMLKLIQRAKMSELLGVDAPTLAYFAETVRKPYLGQISSLLLSLVSLLTKDSEETARLRTLLE